MCGCHGCTSRKLGADEYGGLSAGPQACGAHTRLATGSQIARFDVMYRKRLTELSCDLFAISNMRDGSSRIWKGI